MEMSTEQFRYFKTEDCFWTMPVDGSAGSYVNTNTGQRWNTPATLSDFVQGAIMVWDDGECVESDAHGNPLKSDSPQTDIATRLLSMASQENCDGDPYDTMQQAEKEEIKALRARLKAWEDSYKKAMLDRPNPVESRQHNDFDRGFIAGFNDCLTNFTTPTAPQL